jgi:hypothetical protein
MDDLYGAACQEAAWTALPCHEEEVLTVEYIVILVRYDFLSIF